MIWVIFNVACSVVAACMVCYLLGRHIDLFNMVEGWGIALIGAGAVLTIGPTITKGLVQGVSPYDDWSGMVLRIGVIIMLFGFKARLEGWIWSPRLTHTGSSITG